VGVIFEKETADRILSETYPVMGEIYNEISRSKERDRLFNQLSSEEKDAFLKIQTADAHLHQARLNLQSTFDKAYRYAKDEKTKEELKKEAKKFEKNLYGGYTTEEFEKLPKEKAREVYNNHMNLQNQFILLMQNFLEKEVAKLTMNNFYIATFIKQFY
jgi:Txe/YoeB family toxin of Txe-Axe toxin-antitoxin module